jgi:hypothetical protein
VTFAVAVAVLAAVCLIAILRQSRRQARELEPAHS